VELGGKQTFTALVCTPMAQYASLVAYVWECDRLKGEKLMRQLACFGGIVMVNRSNYEVS